MLEQTEVVFGRIIISMMRVGQIEVHVARTVFQSIVYIHAGPQVGFIACAISESGTNLIDPRPNAAAVGTLLKRLDMGSPAVSDAYTSLSLLSMARRASQDIFLVDDLLDGLLWLGLDTILTRRDKTAIVVQWPGHSTTIEGRSADGGTVLPESLSVAQAEQLVADLGFNWGEFRFAYNLTRGS